MYLQKYLLLCSCFFFHQIPFCPLFTRVTHHNPSLSDRHNLIWNLVKSTFQVNLRPWHCFWRYQFPSHKCDISGSVKSFGVFFGGTHAHRPVASATADLAVHLIGTNRFGKNRVKSTFQYLLILFGVVFGDTHERFEPPAWRLMRSPLPSSIGVSIIDISGSFMTYRILVSWIPWLNNRPFYLQYK